MEVPLDVRRVSITHPDAAALVEAVQQEYVVRYGTRDESPVDPADFEPPDGEFFVGYVEDQAVASGAWRRTAVRRLGASSPAEVKRMYVVPAHQRRGLARQMLAHLEQTARAAGHDGLVLETGQRQPEAIAFYTALGFEPVEAFGHYRDAAESVHLGRLLSG